jgi:hypothetical protein
MAKVKWLDRRIAAPGPFLTLCLDQAEFDKACSHIKIKNTKPFVNAGSAATTHFFHNDSKAGTVAIVCISEWAGRDPVEVAGLLVHEAVHVWQEYADGIGEKSPGVEQEAYAVQAIAQELMAEFARRMGARK